MAAAGHGIAAAVTGDKRNLQRARRACASSTNASSMYIEFEIDQKFAIKIEKNVTFLGVQIDENLRFDANIDKICKKAANQLNSLKRLARFMGDREKKIIMNSFILFHFNYCPLIWML